MSGPRAASSPIEVVKLGGSVLPDLSAFGLVAREARRVLAAGRRPFLVLSARAGVTDRLLASARAHAECPDEALLARLLATGETAAAALAGIVLEGAGLAAGVLCPRTAGFRVSGPSLEAAPVAVDKGAVEAAFDRADALIMPGFVGHDAHGRMALLGRGGSDLTALFLAHALDGRCRLIKDTGALFDADPNRHSGARRFIRARWRTAAARGGGLVQPASLRFAARHRLDFEIASTDGTVGTIVDQGPDILVDPVGAAGHEPRDRIAARCRS